MAKPRIKLKAATNRRPLSARAEQQAGRLLAQLGKAVGMSVDEIKRDPLEARRRREKIEQPQRLEARLCQAVGMSPDEFRRDPEKAQARVEEWGRVMAGGKAREEDWSWLFPREVTDKIYAERQRALDIAQACQVVGQTSLIGKLVVNGTSLEESRDYIFDVAAAHTDGQYINGSHSPEGGRRAGIDYNEIYARQNGRKGERA